ncbi:MAG: SRPBCC family protein [Acidobacteria bacterium]|nr:SRPBCC family protein [Acidobacteriota bacterium]
MTAATKPKFVYVTYISSTPENVFNALTDPEMTKQYWVRHRNASDWKPGSEWRHEDYDDPSLVDIVGTVVERTPPKTLVITWAFPADKGNAAKTSRVRFDVEPWRSVVRLTVTHDELEPGGPMLKGVSSGWPLILSSLKTLLESGRPLAGTSTRMTEPPK